MATTKQRYIRITSAIEGFRRAGITHSRTPTDHPAASITDTQLAQLEAEPNLVLQMIDKDVEQPDDDGDDKPGVAAGKKAAGK